MFCEDAIFHRFSVFVWTGEIDSNTLCVDAYLFSKRRKKFSVFQNIRIREVGAWNILQLWFLFENLLALQFFKVHFLFVCNVWHNTWKTYLFGAKFCFCHSRSMANRAFSLTCPASMQIYWNKRKRLHKKNVWLPQDSVGTPISSPWRHVKKFSKNA